MRLDSFITRVYMWLVAARQLEAFKEFPPLLVHVYLENIYFPYPGDLQQYFHRFTKQGMTFDPSRFQLFMVSGVQWQFHEQIYCDALYSIVLADVSDSKEPKAIASIGFDLLDPKTIIIRQVQGKQGQHELLAPLRWERMLIAVVKDWARKHEFHRVLVQPAHENRYYNDFSAQRLKMHYDVSAERSGFRFDKKLGVYALDLTKAA